MGPEKFDFHLPEDAIAQSPCEQRSDARMMVLSDNNSQCRDGWVRELGQELPENALVVVNDSQVVPARLFLTRNDGREFELLFCRAHFVPSDLAVPIAAWVKGAKRLQVGDLLECGELMVRYFGRDAVDSRACLFTLISGDLKATLTSAGKIPLPPYLHRPKGPLPIDEDRYQTVYSRNPGSVAAPTAGLHFDKQLLGTLDHVSVTLHVGPGTFLPMDVEDVHQHRVGHEHFHISEKAAATIRSARSQGRPIVAIGTTVCRALEGAALIHDGNIVEEAGVTDIVITPDHRWQIVDRLLTNFHLPKSSLLMLTCSFGGIDSVMTAYRRAVDRGYRFYSYGDCMLLRREQRFGVPGSTLPKPAQGR